MDGQDIDAMEPHGRPGDPCDRAAREQAGGSRRADLATGMARHYLRSLSDDHAGIRDGAIPEEIKT